MEFAKLDEILLGNILKAVEDNLSEAEFDVQHLAEKVNMSRSTLTRKLKAITGLTPLEYIRRVKMQHACRMLKRSSYHRERSGPGIRLLQPEIFYFLLQGRIRNDPQRVSETAGKRGYI